MYLYAVEQPVSFNHSVHACVISQLILFFLIYTYFHNLYKSVTWIHLFIHDAKYRTFQAVRVRHELLFIWSCAIF